MNKQAKQPEYIEQGPNSEFLDLPKFDFDVEYSKYINLVGREAATLQAFLSYIAIEQFEEIAISFQDFMMDMVTSDTFIRDSIPQLNNILTLLQSIPENHLPVKSSQEMENFIYFQRELDTLRYEVIELRNTSDAYKIGEVHNRFIAMQTFFTEKILGYYSLIES